MTVELTIYGLGYFHEDPWRATIGPGWPRTLAAASVFRDRAAIREHLEGRFPEYQLSQEQWDRLWVALDDLAWTREELGRRRQGEVWWWRDGSWSTWWRNRIAEVGGIPAPGKTYPRPIRLPPPSFHVGSISTDETREELARLQGDPEPPPPYLRGPARSQIFATISVYHIHGVDKVAYRVGGADPDIKPAVVVAPPAPPPVGKFADLPPAELEEEQPDFRPDDEVALFDGLDQAHIGACEVNWHICDSGNDDRFRGWIWIDSVFRYFEFIRVVEDEDGMQRPENPEQQAEYDSFQEDFPGNYKTFEVPGFRGRYIAVDCGLTA